MYWLEAQQDFWGELESLLFYVCFRKVKPEKVNQTLKWEMGLLNDTSKQLLSTVIKTVWHLPRNYISRSADKKTLKWFVCVWGTGVGWF